MEDHRFDRLIRNLASAPSRRNVLKSIATGGAASVAGLFMTNSRQAKAATALLLALDPDERAIAFYEQLTDIAHLHAHEGCDKIAVMTKQFPADNAAVLEEIRSEDAAWTRDQHEAYVVKYSDRLEVATRKGHFARERCRYANEAHGGAGTPAAGTPAASVNSAEPSRVIPFSYSERTIVAAREHIQSGCGGKGCADHCPLDRTECIETWGGCIAGGDDCQCCLSSLCGSKSHCLTDCDSNECCSGVPACNGAFVPPPPQ